MWNVKHNINNINSEKNILKSLPWANRISDEIKNW